MTTTIKLGQNGRVIIPAEVRHTLNLKAGDELLVTLEDKRLVLETEGELVSNELLRERRDEARREDAER